TGRFLRVHGYQHHDERKDKERYLLQKETTQGCKLQVEGCKLQAAQRPPVQQKQHQRQCDEHRFAQQAEGEEKEGENVAERNVKRVPCSVFRLCHSTLATRHVGSVRVHS